MSKKAFPINRVNIDPPKPVRVAPNPPIALPEREPRNIWVMIGVPALIVALIGTIVMLYVSGVRSLATGFFPLMGIGAFSMLAFSGRFGRARKITWGELEKGRRRYLRDLDTNRDEIQTAVCAQREWQNAVHSDPPGLGAIIGGPRMWERGRGDVDFLEVRVGTGVQHAPDSVLSVTWPDISSDEELEPVTGQALRDFILEQRKIRDIAKVVNLRSAPGFSFVSEDLDRVRSLMRSVLCSLAVFHNPRDVKLMVVTRNPEVWAWMVWLPHNLHDELFDACGWRRLIFATPEELEAALGAELHMKGKRGAWTPPTVASPTAMGSALETGQVGVDLGPHLVIVDDNTGSPDAWESVVGQVGKAGLTVLRIASRVGTGVGFAEDQVFEMAQRHGAATAVKAGRDGADADDDQRPAPLLRARGTFFAHADQLSIHRAYRYARAMARWSPTSRSEVTDSTSGAAELLRSLGISDPRELDVDRLWALGAAHALIGLVVVVLGAITIGVATRKRWQTAVVTAVVTVCGILAAVAAVRMFRPVSMQVLAICVLVGLLVLIRMTPTVALWVARVRPPHFGSITGRDLFARRAGMPVDTVAPVSEADADDEDNELTDITARGTAIAASARLVNAVQVGMCVGVSLVLPAAVWGVLTPRQPWAWLALLVAGLTVGLFITQGRGFAAKYQAVALVCGASAAVCAGVLKYALDTPKGVQTGLLWPAIFVAAFAALGLAVALVVPATRFRPIIRLTVEWLEVLAMIALLPAAAAGTGWWIRSPH